MHELTDLGDRRSSHRVLRITNLALNVLLLIQEFLKRRHQYAFSRLLGECSSLMSRTIPRFRFGV